MAQPVTIEAEFGGVDTFVDLTSRSISFTVNRGRTDYTQPYYSGRAQVVMRNLDGELDPDNTGGTYYGEILTGRRIKIISNKGDAREESIYVGTIVDYALSYDLSGQATVTILCNDGLAPLAQQALFGFSVPEELTGARVTRVLNRPTVDYQGPTSIDTGYSTCASGTATGNALAYLHQVATTEQGAVFVDRAGVFQFVDRYELLKPSTLTFTDDGGGINYQQIRRLVTQTELYNELGANREGQSQVTRENTANQAIYGVRFVNLGEVLFPTDAEVTDMLDYALVRYSATTPRVASITVFLDDKTAAQVEDILTLDLASSVTVEFTPPGVSQLVLQSTIEKIDHAYTYGMGWRVTFGLTPRDTSSYLVLDDVVLGRLDLNALAF